MRENAARQSHIAMARQPALLTNPPARLAGITGVRTASVAASRPTKSPSFSPKLSPTLTIMNRTRRSLLELDLRQVIGHVGIDSWHPCSLLKAVALAALGVSGDADAGQVRGQLVAAEIAVLRQLRRWGRFGGW